jgi:beta-1,4-mannosyl-glycoprotein beta-1,4-N-acetylglucosaminyltransferase
MKYSIIIPTYNNCDRLLKPCVDSIIKYTNLDDAEIIVVANGCTDNTRLYVAQISIINPNIKLLWFNDAIGYTRATNAGIDVAQGEYVIFMNNDVTLLPQEKNKWLDMLQSLWDSEKNTGVVGLSEEIMYGRKFVTFYFAMTSQAVIKKIGKLDEVFITGGEDIDFCFRAQQAGYEIVSEKKLYDESGNRNHMTNFPMNHIGEATISTLPKITDKHNTLGHKILNNKYNSTKYAIIIPTYNHCDDLLKPCIESIIANTNKPNKESLFDPIVDVHVIVVANGCIDNTGEYLTSLAQRDLPFTLHSIWDKEPLGYTKAVNRGIRLSIELQSDYTILMNNDVTLMDFAKNNQWLEMLTKPFTSSKVGMTGTSKIIDETTRQPFIIFYMAMIKTSIFSKIDVLDEVFNPGYGEDIDFAIRLQRAGYEIVRVPGDGVGHTYTEFFPLVHGAEKTMHDEKSNIKGVFGLSWSEIIARNQAVLRDRYVINPQPDLPEGWFDIEDINEMREMINQMPDGGTMIQLGVWAGRSVFCAADIIKKKNIKVIAVDTFTGSDGDDSYILETSARLNMEKIFLENAKAFKIADNIQTLKMTTTEAAIKVPDKSADLIFIDANHNYEFVKADIANWKNKVKDGGKLSGHDFWFMDVQKALFENFHPKDIVTVHGIWQLRTKTGKIYDCFMFYNELDILDIRLNELYDVVDKFVLVEARFTHQGNPKPLYYEKNKERYAKFADKITHIVVDEMCATDSPYIINQKNKLYFEINYWGFIRERYQRDAIAQGLVDCNDNDTIIISDVDEIVNHEAIKRYDISMGHCALDMRLFYYKLNCEGNTNWHAAHIMPYKFIKDKYPSDVRYDDQDTSATIPNAGWHFSYLSSTVENITDKIKSFSVEELNIPSIVDAEHIAQSVENATDIFNRGIQFKYIKIDDTYPAYVVNNKNQLIKKGLIKSNMAEINKTKYSIIIPTTGNYLNKLDVCLSTLMDVTDMSNVELIIVANGVTNETKEYLRVVEHQDDINITTLYSPEPLGFPKAINMGIKRSTGDYVVLLNDDVVFIPQSKNEWLDIMSAPFTTPENVGVTGLKLLGSSFSKQEYLMFFCVMFRRSVIDVIGLLDENFSPAFVEDEEYCLRATQFGYKIQEVGAQVYHKSSATLNNFEEKRQIVKRNRYYLLNKYFPNDLVNFIVPTFNRHDELRRALNSIEAQTYDKIKVWVCADGHDEKVKQIVEEFNDNSEHKVYIYLALPQHEGLLGSKPRMMGIDALANTGVVCFLDDDNTIQPTYVEKLFKAIRSDGGYQKHETYVPDSTIISYCVINHSHSNKPIPIPGHVQGMFEYSNIDTLNIMVNCQVAKLCKAKWLHVAGQKITHDIDFIQECAKKGKSVFVNEILADHHMSSDKVNGNNVEPANAVAWNNSSRITIGYIKHNEEMLKANLQPSIDALTNKNYDVIRTDDKLCPATNYNHIIEQSPNDYILLLHEDVIFSPNFLDKIWETIKLYPNFGVLGVEGAINSEDLAIFIRYEWAVATISKILTTIDSAAIVINKKHGLKFDDKIFNEYHAYVEDYCMQARALGLERRTLLINTYPAHWTGYKDPANYFIHKAQTCNTVGYNWGNFVECYEKLQKKWAKKHGKIYDCFQFYNELDILDIRFNTLYEHVDKFVLVEARFTHQGKEKPLYFEENKARYTQFSDKIEHIILDKMIPWDDPYILKQKNKQYFERGDQNLIRERYQRDMMVRAWTNCTDDDIIIISDVDEIINPEALKKYDISMGYTAFVQRLFYYKLNCEIFVPWDKARIMPYKFIKDKYPSDVRFDLDNDVKNKIENGGWHFSYLYNDPTLVADKIKSFCHAEFNTPEITDVKRIEQIIERGEDLYGRGHTMHYVPMDDNYPKYILDRKDYYYQKGLIKPIYNNDNLKAYDNWTYDEIFDKNLYDIQPVDIQGKTLIDIGANVGMFALRCAELGMKHAHCFEPQSGNYKKMLELIAGKPNITPYKMAILDGSVKSVHMRNDGVCSDIYGTDKDEEVPCMSLNDVMNLFVLPKSDVVLKLDCEGSEYEIIYNSPKELIQSFETIFIEIHNVLNPKYVGKAKELGAYIESLGFDRIPAKIAAGYWTNDGKTFNEGDNMIAKYKRKAFIKALSEFTQDEIRLLDAPTYDEIYKVNVYGMDKAEIKDSIVLDIGANHGLFSLRALEMGAIECYAFEPEKENYSVMMGLIKKHPAIKPFKVAVSDGAVSMVHMFSENVTSNIWGAETGEAVKCISLVEAASYANFGTHKKILKLDCEGSEYEILMHSPADVVQQFDIIYLEIHDNMNPNFKGQTDNLLNYMKFIGFDVTHQGPQWGGWFPDGTFAPAPIKVFKLQRARTPERLPDRKQRIYDCFMFNDELDVLDIRFAELGSLVDYFVIVESHLTHSGKPKPLYFKDNETRYAKYADKIRHIVFDDMPQTDNAWHRESHQRDACAQGLYDAKDYDIIISGDADEIPKKEVLAAYNTKQGVVAVETKYYFYFLNCERQDKGTTHLRLLPYYILKPYTFCYFRYKDYPMITDGGWHFSFIGDVKQIKKKIESYAHQEYNTPHFTDETRLEKIINEGGDILEKGMIFKFIDINEKFPKFIQENKQKFIDKKYIKPVINKKEINTNRLIELNPTLFKEIFELNQYYLFEEDVKGKIFVDVGANYGYVALLADKLGAKKILAFEPNSNNYKILEELTAGYDNIITYKQAVYNSADKIRITDAGITSNIFKTSEKDEEIPAISLRQIIDLIPSNEPAVLKLDCEGAEFDIIYKAPKELVRRFDILYLEIHNDMAPEYLNGSDNLIAYLSKIGFISERLPFVSGIWTADGVFHKTNNTFYKSKRDILTEQQLRLHLDCGADVKEGYLNIDVSHPNADMWCDKLHLPFPIASVDKIWAHIRDDEFFTNEFSKLRNIWWELLKPGGTLMLTPPLDGTNIIPTGYLSIITHKPKIQE